MVERKISSPPGVPASSSWGSWTTRRHGEARLRSWRASDLPRLVDELEIDWVILAFSQSSYEETLDLLRAARRPDVHLSIVPRFFEVFASNATIQELEGMPVVNLPPMRLSRGVRFTKRAVDVVVARLGLRAARPAAGGRRGRRSSSTAAGPCSSARSATGVAAAIFRIVKFRTMRAGAEGERRRWPRCNEVDGRALQDQGRPAHDARGPAPAARRASTSCRSSGTC